MEVNILCFFCICGKCMILLNSNFLVFLGEIWLMLIFGWWINICFSGVILLVIKICDMVWWVNLVIDLFGYFELKFNNFFNFVNWVNFIGKDVIKMGILVKDIDFCWMFIINEISFKFWFDCKYVGEVV